MIHKKQEGKVFDIKFLGPKANPKYGSVAFDEVLKIGDKLLILAEGVIMGNYHKVNHRVETSDGRTFLVAFNNSSMRNIQDTYGDDDHEWIGKFAVYQGIKDIKGMKGNIFTAEA